MTGFAIDRATLWDRLAGTWVGEGAGSYPDVVAFRYAETLLIAPEPDWNMLTVLQRTWRHGVPGAGLHLETGMIQGQDDGALVYSCAQDSGRTEVMRGVVSPAGEGLRIDWVTVAHSYDDRLLRMGRTWCVTGSGLRYEAHLATVRNPDYRKHLEATLYRET